MTNQAFPELNNVTPSWADIAVTCTVIGGDLLGMLDIKGIKWSRKVEVGVKRGASGGRVMGRTTGEGSQEASMELYRSGLRALIKSLMKAATTANLVRGNQLIIGGVAFDIMIQYSVPGDSEIYQVKIKGCRYLGDSDDAKEGTDAGTVEVTLNPMEVVQIINGQEVVLV